MPQPRMFLPDVIRQALDETGLPWAIEPGSRHQHIRLCGRLVTVLPRKGGAEEGRGTRNVIAAIRRKARELRNAGK